MNRNINQNMSSSSYLLIDSKIEEQQMFGYGGVCPNCGYKVESKPDWVGLPAGVKFDPTDQELIEHLEAQVIRSEDQKSHPLIDEFIPTIHGEDGICYTHPEKLPGVTRDGLSKHFFHRPSKAYTTGTRKRRKIQTAECGDLQGSETRWHKTGKTRPVVVNGRQKGCKKILVLYTNFGKHRKPEKTNWVMHQYHLGELEEEKDGELVVSKIFYQTQPRHCNWSAERAATAAAAAAVAATSSGGEMHRATVDSGSGSTEIVIGGRDRDDHQVCSIAGFSGYGSAGLLDLTGVIDPTTTTSTASAFHQISTGGVISPMITNSNLDIVDPYQRLLLQHNESLHQKMVGRPGSGLEELIRGCTSAGLRGQEPSIADNQETDDWYPPYWPEQEHPNPDQHQHHHGI